LNISLLLALPVVVLAANIIYFADGHGTAVVVAVAAFALRLDFL
jgi:hypothetical protein